VATAAAAVVLGTADGRRTDPATPGIRRLVHRPGGVLTHWRRDGCGQPVPGMFNARPSTGRCTARDSGDWCRHAILRSSG